PRADRPLRRAQARGRHPLGEAGARLAGDDQGGAGRPLAPARSLPVRRLEPSHRHRAAARASRDGAVQRGPPAPDDMTSIRDAFQTMAWGTAPESPATAEAWLARHPKGFGHSIGGAWVEPSAGERFATTNPATGAELARVAQGSKEDVEAAVRAARGAQPGWWALGGHGRARWLYALA